MLVRIFAALARSLCLAAVAALLGPDTLSAQAPAQLIEPPSLAKAVAAGVLPPLAERLPQQPSVVEFAAPLQPGEHGGDLRTLIRKSADTKLLVVYGYARLVGYTPDLDILPDILAGYEVENGRIFTLKLRPGHRWSDGHPFTAEDFRYYWEDVANNPDLSPSGPSRALAVAGEPARFEVIDEHTVRYTWSRPNPAFLPQLAGAFPLVIYRPAHYLRQFHRKHADPETLAQMLKTGRVANWAVLHESKGNMYRLGNPDLPTLQPWMLRTPPPARRFIAERNPYYHRIDGNGRQLPYIDRILLTVTRPPLILPKTLGGEVDLQARGLTFDDTVLLRQALPRDQYRTYLWRQGTGSEVALYPNFNVNDPVWRDMVRDVRFRRALSLATDRSAINNFLFLGLARESNNTVLPESPLFKPTFQTSWAQFDLEAANALLDEIGLTQRDGAGIRLLPDGRPLQIVVQTAGESQQHVDTLEIIAEPWEKAGVKLFIKPSQRELLRRRVAVGDALMTTRSGLANGIATAEMSPEELAPHHPYDPQWPKWGSYIQSEGKSGEPVDLPEVQRLLELKKAWQDATNTAERLAIWQEMLAIHADQVFTIGTVSGVPQPIVVSTRLMNVPEEGHYNWDPGAGFGMYRPDTFWFLEQ